MFLKCLLLLCVLVEIEGWPTSTCATPRIQNGRVRLRQRNKKLVKFLCLPRYTLVGDRYATCRNGEWDVDMPVCVKSGCKLPTFEDAKPGDHSRPMIILSHFNAVAMFFCYDKHKLVGSSTIHCDGRKWNDSIPHCVASKEASPLSCDFEDANLCGWTQDELHDFDWRRLNRKTPSAFLNTGPSSDHTYGKYGNGYYMYIESTSRLENETARLISPLYESHLTKDGCFQFFYHMFGKTIGSLKVYQKPDRVPLQELLQGMDNEKYLLFEKQGEQGDVWYTGVVSLVDSDEDFQIVIEGIRGSSYTSDIAIDDVSILQGDKCRQANETATTPYAANIFADSCRGRCDLFGTEPTPPAGVCSCQAGCLDGACCADFLEACVFDEPTTEYSQEFQTTVPCPLTEKLVAQSTVSSVPETIPTTKLTLPTTKLIPTTIPTIPTTSPTPTTVKTTTSTTTKPKITSKLALVTAPIPKRTTLARKISTLPPLIFRTSVKFDNKTGLLENATTKKKLTTTKATTKATTRATAKATLKARSTQSSFNDKTKAGKGQNVQQDKLLAPGKIITSHGSNTALIVIAGLMSCVAVVWLLVWSRGGRGRATIARLRGRVRHDPDVQYLNSAADDE